MGGRANCKNMNTKLFLCLLGAALSMGAFAANTCKICSNGATSCTSQTCSGSQKCLATSYVSSGNNTKTSCDVASICSTYSIADNGCKKVNSLLWDTSYYCSTSTPAWAESAAKNSTGFPNSVSCPSQSA